MLMSFKSGRINVLQRNSTVWTNTVLFNHAQLLELSLNGLAENIKKLLFVHSCFQTPNQKQRRLTKKRICET